MDIFRFMKWWWDQRSEYEKTIIFVFSMVALVISSCFVFGLVALRIAIFIGLLSVILYFGYRIGKSIMNQWYQFQIERDREARRIIARLGGAVDPEDRTQSLLERIRTHGKVKA